MILAPWRSMEPADLLMKFIKRHLGCLLIVLVIVIPLILILSIPTELYLKNSKLEKQLIKTIKIGMTEKRFVSALENVDIFLEGSKTDNDALKQYHEHICLEDFGQFKRSEYDYKACSNDFCKDGKMLKVLLYRSRNVYLFVMIDKHGKVGCYIVDES